ncbi:hypothetical protein [Cellulomonas sp. URHE0023]|uniref:hypothetical protein n=1 Tax=Cellulomonas sp. URHE0023 TaxID=1380354 RepID=UPI00048435C9|nr:hypothetical protein [Cellulomonas sp. URHE0023]
MSDTGPYGGDPTQPGGRPAWGQPGSTPPTTPPPATSWQATPPAAAPFPGAPTAAVPAAVPATAGDEPPADEPSGRPRWLIPVIIGVVVVVLVAIIVGIVASRGSDDEAATPAVASTVLLPSPTPTLDAVQRPATTAFATALPLTVLQYALGSSAENPAWVTAGAIEAYTETYTDGDTGTVTVSAGQWETPAEATAFAATLVAALPSAPAPDPTATATAAASTLPQSGEVTAAGAAVGSYTIADNGDGTGTAVWTNATTVFQVTAPVADIVNFYSAYPL